MLTISASDAGAQSGIQADLLAFAALGVSGLTAVTQLGARNRRGQQRLHPVPPRFVAAQIDLVASDGRIDAVKTGLLGSWQMVALVAERARRRRLVNLVVDPWMADSMGDGETGRRGDGETGKGIPPTPPVPPVPPSPVVPPRLLGGRGVELLRRQLLPVARVVTPTVPEVEWLTGQPARNPAEMRLAAAALARTGVGAVLIQGAEFCLLYENEAAVEIPLANVSRWSPPRDAFTAALAVGLALGDDVPAAVARALAFLETADGGVR